MQHKHDQFNTLASSDNVNEQLQQRQSGFVPIPDQDHHHLHHESLKLQREQQQEQQQMNELPDQQQGQQQTEQRELDTLLGQQQEQQKPLDRQELDLRNTVEALKQLITAPPFSTHNLKVDESSDTHVKRAKRKSKFTKEQDEMIIDLKRRGKSWVDIAAITGVGSFLTARNRYQVLMGQQGVASVFWSAEDTKSLQNIVDQGELEKWRFISKELYKLTGRFFTDVQCRQIIKELFLENPSEFGVDEDTVLDIIADLNRANARGQQQTEKKS